jgi:hypothetical protein
MPKPSKRTPHYERHVRLYHRMMKTAAWTSLSPNARAVYIEIEARYGGFGSNNGRIVYSVRMASEGTNIGKTAAARALIDLQDRGFIRMTKRGAFSLKSRHATEWRLTTHASDVSSQAATKEYEHWQPPEKNTVPERGPDGTCTGTERYLREDRARANGFQHRLTVPVARPSKAPRYLREDTY